MAEKNEDLIVETMTEDGELVQFEVFDIIEFEDKEYALLMPVGEENSEESEIVLMRLITEGEDYVFESIEDDDEFERVSEYIESLEDEIDD